MKAFRNALFLAILWVMIGCQSAPLKVNREHPSLADYDLTFLKAQLHIYAEEYEEAEKTLSESLSWMTDEKKREGFELMLAKVEIERGKRKKAYERYSKLLAAESPDAKVMSEAAKFFYEIGDKGRAQALYIELTQVRPKDSNNWIYKGLLSLEQGDFKSSWDSFDYLVQNSKDAKHLGQYYMGKLMQMSGREKSAKRYFNACLKTDITFSECALDLARQQQRKGMSLKAEKTLYDYLSKIESGKKPILAQLAQWHLMKKDFVKARWCLERLERISPKDVDVKRRLALVMAYTKDFKPSLERLKLIVQSDKVDEGDAINYLNILMLNKKKKTAFDYITRVQDEDYLGRAFFFKRNAVLNTTLSKETLNKNFSCKGLRLNEKPCLYVQGTMAYKKGDFKFTKSTFKKFIKKYPTEAGVFYMYGRVLDDEGFVKKGEAHIEKALMINADYSPALNFKAYSLAKKNTQLGLAKDYILNALSQDPQNGHFLDTYGLILYRLAEYKEALQILLIAAKKLPTDPAVYEHIGDVYISLNNETDALKFYTLARTLYKGENSSRIGGKIAKVSKPNRSISSIDDSSSGDQLPIYEKKK